MMIAYEGHVKILDFGVAKFETGGHETRTGEVKGKMAYMSPEQALGEKLDRRSDLFSVGAVLFECLTGRRMWGAGTDLEVMRRLALEEPPRLDEAMPDAPPALVELHARLVARDPASRPDTAKDVADELRAYASAWPRAGHGGGPRRSCSGSSPRRRRAQREQLTEALQQAAPTRVESLRKTLDPRGDVRAPDDDRAGHRRESERLPGRAGGKRSAGGASPLVGGGALVAIALGAVAVARQDEREGRRAAGEPTATPGPTPTADPRTRPHPRPPPPAARRPRPRRRRRPLRPRPTAGSTPDGNPPKTRSTPRAAPRPTATSRLPDVDPTPF